MIMCEHVISQRFEIKDTYVIYIKFSNEDIIEKQIKGEIETWEVLFNVKSLL